MSKYHLQKKIRVLFLNAYFYPENIAFSHLEQDIMEGLVKAGHEIDVVCPVPTRGISKKEAKEYRTKKHEDFNNIHVQRYWAPPERKNPISRAFRYLWCNFRGNIVGRRYRDIDVVFAVSTPPTQGLFAGMLAKKLKAKFVYSIQDVFPDSLVTTGLAKKDSLLYKIGAKIEKKTYGYCSNIIVLSKTVKQNLLNKGVDSKKLLTVNNWIDSSAVRPVSREQNQLFDEFGIDREKFIVVYAGNFGASQGADIIFKAAEKLKDNPEIVFVVFGGGSEFEKAQETVEKMELQNVAIHPILPLYRVSEAYSMGNVALITCKRGVSQTAMPSKTWSIMACNTPIIASFDTDSELAEILSRSGAGICVEPEDPEALSKAIQQAYEDYRSGTAAKDLASREYVKKFASKKIGVNKYADCVEGAVNS